MRIVVIGEGMVELAPAAGGWKLGYAGDTLNTAIHLARLGAEVAFVTALGPDPFSAELRAACLAEGLDPATLLNHPTRNVGLYAISLDAAGERSFTYWRGESAARAMFDLPGMAVAAERAAGADLVLFSLITLAILPPQGRAALLDLARRARAVAFDGNYRPRLWPDRETALAARDAALAVADFGLPSTDDEAALTG
jgi:2-dehydro-3-deoxygluconokinase